MTIKKPNKYELCLPVEAVSLNEMFVGGKHGVLSTRYRDFKELVQWSIVQALGCSPVPLEGDVAVKIKFYMPSRRNDLDNLYKGLLDACEGLLYKNDNQVKKHWVVELEKDRDSVRIELGVYSLAEWRLDYKIARRSDKE